MKVRNDSERSIAMKTNDEKIRNALTSESVPDELSPENIKTMLDKKAPVKKRKSILKTASRITAGAAACAVICGTSVYFAEQKKDNYKFNSASESGDSSSEAIYYVGQDSEKLPVSYLNTAKSYSEIYSMLSDANERYYKNYVKYNDKNFDIAEEEVADGDYVNNGAEIAPDNSFDDNAAPGDGDREHSDTYNQEEGVLEADIAKTDGKYIYFLDNYTGSGKLNIAETDNGSFTASTVYDVSKDIAVEENDAISSSIDVSDMYIYNDMLIVIGNINQYYETSDMRIYNECVDCICGGWYDSNCAVFVNVYTTGLEPQLVSSYTQDGYYDDVRISDDDFLYLVTEYCSAPFDSIDDRKNLDEYVPACSENGKCKFVPADGIVIPDGDLADSENISYTVIGSLDVNTPGKAESVDIKAIAGYSGNVYCSSDNLYTSSGWEETVITRFALDGGVITPAASGTVKGSAIDQFSMSEYNGYFRIATTEYEYEESIFDGIASYSQTRINNYVYVLDMELEQVGVLTGFGEGETIKSVNFSGDTAYVVTYEQTDPLFSIDLSDPAAPVLMDGYELLGYSTYMQQWGDGMLLGFGAYADENGIEDGVKFVMFDNSDPNNLGEIDSVRISSEEADHYQYIYSPALWERKALLIAPEKNIIGVPIGIEEWGEDVDYNYTQSYSYRFYSFTDGKFVPLGEIKGESEYEMLRAVYIGDHVYALSGGEFVSASIADLTVKDRVTF